MKVYSDVSKAPKRRVFKNIVVLDEDGLTIDEIDDIHRRKQDHGSNVILYAREPSDFSKTKAYLDELTPTYLMFNVFNVKDSSNLIEYYNDYTIIANILCLTDYNNLANIYNALRETVEIVGIPLTDHLNYTIGYGKTYAEIVGNGRYEVIQKMTRDGIWDWRKPHCLVGCTEKDHELYKNINVEFAVDV